MNLHNYAASTAAGAVVSFVGAASLPAAAFAASTAILIGVEPPASAATSRAYAASTVRAAISDPSATARATLITASIVAIVVSIAIQCQDCILSCPRVG